MANSLGELILPLMSTLENITPDLTSFQGSITQDFNPNLQQAAQQLTSSGQALDFSGLGADSFQEAIQAHLDETDYFTSALQNANSAMNTLLNAVSWANVYYDGLLSGIRGDIYSYAPGFFLMEGPAEGAHYAFLNLNAEAAMITHVLDAANGNDVLLSGAAALTGPLMSAYERLNMRVEQETIPIISEKGGPPDANMQWEAQTMVLNSIERLYNDLNQVYSGWGSAVEHAFSTFTAALRSAEQQLQPAIDILNGPTSAASIFDMIQMVSQTNSPIAITQVGPNSILVMISGTNVSQMGYDTNVWNALMTGMGQDSPFEQDVIEAIQRYCAEHGLNNPSVILAGHSLGGMVAQQIAQKHLFNVTQVVTFGSPVMGPPVPGVKYDLYEADSDLVPLLSRYENPTLPASLQAMAAKFPGTIKLSNPIGSLLSTVVDDAPGAQYLINELAIMLPYMSNADRQLVQQTIAKIAPDAGPLAISLLPIELAELQPKATPQQKLNFMNPNHLYPDGSIQLVPDLTNQSPSVHSQYGQSQFLENQQILLNPSDANIMNSTEYFQMPNQPLTASLNQYMAQNSTPGQLLDFLSLING